MSRPFWVAGRKRSGWTAGAFNAASDSTAGLYSPRASSLAITRPKNQSFSDACGSKCSRPCWTSNHVSCTAPRPWRDSKRRPAPGAATRAGSDREASSGLVAVAKRVHQAQIVDGPWHGGRSGVKEIALSSSRATTPWMRISTCFVASRDTGISPHHCSRRIRHCRSAHSV
jgi:hypothetical protein